MSAPYNEYMLDLQVSPLVSTPANDFIKFHQQCMFKWLQASGKILYTYKAIGGALLNDHMKL